MEDPRDRIVNWKGHPLLALAAADIRPTLCAPILARARVLHVRDQGRDYVLYRGEEEVDWPVLAACPAGGGRGRHTPAVPCWLHDIVEAATRFKSTARIRNFDFAFHSALAGGIV